MMNFPITVNCSLDYEAHSPCLVRLLLYDNESKREVPAARSGHISGQYKKYLWLIMNESGDLRYDSRLLLRIVFNCEVGRHSSKESTVFETGIFYNIPLTYSGIYIYAALACV